MGPSPHSWNETSYEAENGSQWLCNEKSKVQCICRICHSKCFDMEKLSLISDLKKSKITTSDCKKKKIPSLAM